MDWPQEDLLLGEIGQTLRPEYPARLAAGIGLTLVDAAEAAGRTRASLRAWERSAEVVHVRALIAAARTTSPGVVPRARIVEYAAHPDTGTAFGDLWQGLANTPASLTVESSGEHLDGWGWSAWGLAPRAWTLRKLFDHDPDQQLDDLVRLSGLALSGGVIGPIRETSALLEARAADLAGLVADDVAAGVTTLELGLLRQAVTAFLAALDAGPVTPSDQLWFTTRVWLNHLHLWLLQERRYLDAAIVMVRTSLRAHASMASSAFLAVTLDMVPVELREAYQAYEAMWSNDLTDDGPMVVSGSLTRPLDEDFSAAVAELERIRLGSLSGDAARRLYVLAAGNEGASPGPQYNMHLAYTTAAIKTVITVGGCVPDAGRWTACEWTHGYDASVSIDGEPTDFVLPHVCATTMGGAGGGVLHPTTPDRPSDDAELRWKIGSGSSLATPIVAAVCTLVWSAFPAFTAEMVQAAVLRGARRLDGGTFYKPPGPSATITASAAPSWRACLPSAISAAAAIQQVGLRALPAPLVPPPSPPAGETS
jgi:hypothetical protein